MSRVSPRTIPDALLEAADVAIGSHDADMAWATLWLFTSDEFRDSGHLALDNTFLALLYSPIDFSVRRGLTKLDGAGGRVGLRFDGNEVSLLDGERP